MTSISQTWGTEARERELTYPCDRFIPQPEAALYRGVTIYALAPIVFRWLCQIRAAPYSYDLIDNGGRQSPQELTPGLDDLAVGQDVMQIFTLVDFELDRQLTLRLKPRSSASRTFGDIAVSYVIAPRALNSCRLLVKLIANYPPDVKGSFMRALLPWGDLIMMRRQLLNLKQLAERQSHLR
jgi:hypothetical protein